MRRYTAIVLVCLALAFALLAAIWLFPCSLVTTDSVCELLPRCGVMHIEPMPGSDQPTWACR